MFLTFDIKTIFKLISNVETNLKFISNIIPNLINEIF